MANLSGRTALVTGASRGIGRAIALGLAEAGASVAVNYRERAEAAEEVCGLITGAGGRAFPAQADVTDPDAVAAMVKRVVEELGGLDI
ncbi:MAG: SDR family NAD(P)-dependent oxidoreductase, partial [Armatimonadetes bacterium]|nr:SDR family NAD(P)-dependent oxidoreductase [Armatimonadota bacterium]